MTKGPLTRCFLHYIETQLQWKTDRRYRVFSDQANRQWDWEKKMGYPQVVKDLRTAMTRDQRLRVMVACGYYDLVTAYATSEWVERHLDLAPAVADNITVNHYRGGHMMYTNPQAHKNLSRDAEKLIGGRN